MRLADAGESQIAALVKPLYAPLDHPGTRPSGVKATTLSKILHRKRPEFLVLHDKWVQRCYLGEGAPVALAKRRDWSDYMVTVSTAIANDLIDQAQILDTIAAESDCPSSISDVRLLDILAWSSRGDQVIVDRHTSQIADS